MLKPLLEEFLKIEGVSAAVVVGRIGFVIESAVSGKIDIEALGAMASTGLGTSEAMGISPGLCWIEYLQENYGCFFSLLLHHQGSSHESGI